MNTIIKLKYKIDSFLGYIVGIILSIMAILIGASVIDRVVSSSMAWTDEFVRIGVVWTTFLGSYVAIAKKKEIRVDMFVRRTPKIFQAICAVITDILVLYFLYYFTYVSFIFANQFKTYKLPMSGVSLGIVYLVFPIGSVCMCIHYALSLLCRLSSIKNRNIDEAIEGIPAFPDKQSDGDNEG